MLPIIPIPGFSEPFSSISHLLGAVLGFIGTYYLVYKGRGNSRRVIGLLIYSFCFVFLFSMSGVYHLLEKGYTPNYVLHILDYAGIYVLIAGSYTPIHLILFRNIHRWLVLCIVWTLSITGLTLTAVFFDTIPEWLNLTFFLSLGWIGLFTLYHVYKIHSKELFLLIIYGGLSYSIGAICEFMRWPEVYPGVIGPHEVFHLFVLLGAAFHWRLIYKISKYPISSQITIIVKEYPNNVFKAFATSEHAEFGASNIDDLKAEVLTWVDKKFHNEMRPDVINFKYTKEEDIFLK
ncbi:MAG: hemolysin III family protein [Bacteriovoracaceae bacterium]|nr:hemolysin III family protein [Bacteriovoracaceae bacterium]